MSLIVLLGRLMYATVFLFFAISHLTQSTTLAEYARSKGVFFPKTVTWIGGVILLTGSASIALGAWADLGALLIALFMLLTSFVMHAFWRERDESRVAERIQFFKDFALAGAAICLAALMILSGSDLGFALTKPLLAR